MASVQENCTAGLADTATSLTSPNNATRSAPSWLYAIAQHSGDILLSTFILMKKPISFVLAASLTVVLLLSMLGGVWHAAQDKYTTTFAGLCELPIVSFLPSCAPATSLRPTSPTVRADFPGLIEIQHRALDHLTTQAGLGTDLALNIKHAELAVRDLIIVVDSSDLATKDILSATLGDFIVEARQSGRGLQVLSSKVHGTIDSIAAFNKHAFHAIEAAKASAVSPVRLEDAEHAEHAVLQTFQMSLAWFTSSISAIIVDASAAASSLDRLDERLATAHSLCVREQFDNAVALDDVLWELWTRLGGNRGKVRDLKNRASVLRNVQRYRSVAVAYVAGTMLSVIDAELSQLRDRLSAPSFEDARIPIEVQLASIQSSVRRLQEGGLNSGSGRLSLGSE